MKIEVEQYSNCYNCMSCWPVLWSPPPPPPLPASPSVSSPAPSSSHFPANESCHKTNQTPNQSVSTKSLLLLTSAASAMALLALLVALICSATTPSVEANLLLKFRTKWCCPICARNNPQAAAANAASRLWTFWNLPSSRNLHTLHVIAGHPPTVNTRYREFLRFLFYQNVWTLNCDPINDFKKRDQIGLGGLASSCYDSHFNRRQS